MIHLMRLFRSFKSFKTLALLLVTGALIFPACQAQKGLVGGGSAVFAPGANPAGGSTPGSTPTAAAPTTPDGTVAPPVDQVDVTHLKGLIAGHSPRETNPDAAGGTVRRVVWDGASQAATLWSGMTVAQIHASILDEGVSWEVVQESTWKDYSVTFNADGTLDGLDNAEVGVTGPMLYFWRPSGTIPMISETHFNNLQEFLDLYK